MLVSTGVISSRVNLSSARAAVGKLQIQIGATSTGCADVEGHRGIGWAGGCRELNNILDVARRNRLEVHLRAGHEFIERVRSKARVDGRTSGHGV